MLNVLIKYFSWLSFFYLFFFFLGCTRDTYEGHTKHWAIKIALVTLFQFLMFALVEAPSKGYFERTSCNKPHLHKHTHTHTQTKTGTSTWFLMYLLLAVSLFFLVALWSFWACRERQQLEMLLKYNLLIICT